MDPITTLKNILSGTVVPGTNSGPVHSLSKVEKELVDYLSDANKVGYSKTRRQVQVIVEKVAIENCVLHSARVSDGLLTVYQTKESWASLYKVIVKARLYPGIIMWPALRKPAISTIYKNAL